MKIKLIVDEPEFINYSQRKDPIILFTAFDRADNNRFTSDMNNAILALDSKGKKITPRNLSKQSRYSVSEIELNLYEIENIMNGLGIE